LEHTTLPSISREYTLYEIAQMSRSGAAKLFGFKDRGQLGVGAIADIAVYKPSKDIAAMFRRAAYVFKDGERVVRDGNVTHYTRGKTLHISPAYDKNIHQRLDAYYAELYGLPRTIFNVLQAASAKGKCFCGGRMPELIRNGVRIDDSFRGSLPDERHGHTDYWTKCKMGSSSSANHDRICDIRHRLRV